MKKYFTILLISLGIAIPSTSQRSCGAEQYYESLLKIYPELKDRVGVSGRAAAYQFSGTVTIPVVVHVLYNTAEQNLSNEQIESQIQVLNEDYSSTNADIGKLPEPFKKIQAGNTEIRFELRSVTRTATAKNDFEIDLNATGGIKPQNEPIKFSAQGGKDALPCTEVLNMWVGNIRVKGGVPNSLAGYATFPGGPCEFDGVVIHYKYFGRKNAMPPLDKGRTATHEVGHWLNLRHIWGDRNCGNDQVDDTPMQQRSNFGCPVFPKANCTNLAGGEMFMNYMDYVNDTCMYVFSKGQKERMRSALADIHLRSSLVMNQYVNSFMMGGKQYDFKFPTISTLAQLNESAIAKWQHSYLANEKYIVLLKAVKDSVWDTLSAISDAIKLEGLQPGGLYEMKVVSVFNGMFSFEGSPRVFIANKDVFLPGREPRLMNLY